MSKKSISIYLLIIGLLLLGAIGWYTYSFLSRPAPIPATFDGAQAYADVQTQITFGSRVPGTEGHAKIQEWIRRELEQAGWQAEIQKSEALGHPIENIVAKRGDASPQIIVGAHYDTRMFADQDPDPAQHINFVPGQMMAPLASPYYWALHAPCHPIQFQFGLFFSTQKIMAT